MYLYRSYLQFSIHVFFLAQLFSELKSLKNLWSLDEVGIARKDCAKKFNKLRELNTSD